MGKNNYKIEAICATACIFILNPLMGTFAAGIIALYQKSDISLFYFIFLISIFLGLINTTKVLESDILGYSEAFMMAKTTDLFPYLKEFGKEPVYYSFMYFFSKILHAEFKFFIFFQTLISYIFYLNAVKKFQQKINGKRSAILFAISIATLFFELFSLSAHLLRQFLAASIFLYYLIDKLFYSKNKWGYLILSIFIHSSVLLFVPLLFFPFLKKRLNIWKLILTILFFGLMFHFIPVLSLFIVNKAGIGFATYVFSRTASSSFDDNSTIISAVLIIINLILILYGIYKNYIFKTDSDSEIYFNHIIMFLAFFVLISLNQPLLALRFNFYSYFIFPMAVSAIISKINLKSFFPVIANLIIIIMLYRFGYKLENGAFTFLPLLNIIINPLFFYL
jgi:hypothetical protein